MTLAAAKNDSKKPTNFHPCPWPGVSRSPLFYICSKRNALKIMAVGTELLTSAVFFLFKLHFLLFKHHFFHCFIIFSNLPMIYSLPTGRQ